MNFILTEEQTMLAETARRFADQNVSLERFRSRRGAPTHDPELWQKMVDMGWTALTIDEAHDGLGLGMAEAIIVFEVLGRNLCTEPLWSATMLGGAAIAGGGTAPQRSEWLPRVADGTMRVALAYDEAGSRYSMAHCRTRATHTADGWTLKGEKSHVLDTQAATHVLVLARTAGGDDDPTGTTLFMVPRDRLNPTPHRRVDGRDGATLPLDGLTLTDGAVLGGPDSVGDGLTTLHGLFDRAVIALAAELLGAAQQALDISIAYLQEREQFGAALGSFQALQHRAAKVFIHIEMARSAVLMAARALDADSPHASRYASLAKAKAGDALDLAAREGIQFHGGVGMTDEYDIGFFLKRHRGGDATLGDTKFHLRRWATLSGY